MQDSEEGLDFSPLHKAYEFSLPYLKIGKVLANRGQMFEISLNRAVIGSNVEFVTEAGDTSLGEVVSIHGNKCYAMPYQDLSGINSETKIYHKELNNLVGVNRQFLGRVIDFHGNPIDGKGPITGPREYRNLYSPPINPLERPPITKVIDTGINAINGLISMGMGQRVAIMAGSGVGKSVLLGMMARFTKADINVIALIGERGREVLEFLENDLGEEGLSRTVVVVATSDTSPLVRMRAAYLATTIAEYFRDQNNNVFLMMDSITRFAMAAREVMISVGDPPGQKGYTPGVFAKFPKLLERVGTKKNSGSITGIYTVLVEGGDMDEPVADAIRAIVDGHIILNRELAERNIFPAIDILSSVSRVMNKVVSKEHRIIASHLRDLLASYKENEDLIMVGAYARGSNAKVDKALVIYEKFVALMKQDQDQDHAISIEELYDHMVDLAKMAEKAVNPENII